MHYPPSGPQGPQQTGQGQSSYEQPQTQWQPVIPPPPPASSKPWPRWAIIALVVAIVTVAVVGNILVMLFR